MIYCLRDMIYGLRRMIYLLCKYDIISVPTIREAYIICEADIIASAISPVPRGTDIIVKNLFCLLTKEVFYMVDTRGLETISGFDNPLLKSLK